MSFSSAYTYAMEMKPPLGLVQLYHMDKVVVHQETSHTSKKAQTYLVKAPDGKVIFKAVDEEPSSNKKRKKHCSFDIHVYDSEQIQVMQFSLTSSTTAPTSVSICVCGQLSAFVSHAGATPEFCTHDPLDPARALLRISAPKPKCIECDFYIYGSEGERLGVVSKKWGGLAREVFTTCDTYQLSFPADIHVSLKAAVIANTILIDYLYYN